MSEQIKELEQKDKEARQALGEPLALEFSEYTRKLRMSLITSSVVALIVVFAHVSISPSSTVFGLTFRGLNDHVMLVMLLIVNIYTTIHFLWCSWDHWQEWRIRQSGTKLVFQTRSAFANPHTDHPKDPRQSTLYNWWLQVAAGLPDVQHESTALLTKFHEMEAKINGLQADAGNLSEVAVLIQTVRHEMTGFHQGLARTAQALDAPRLRVSLERFDGAYRRMLESQNLRWAVLEMGLPTGMGILAATMLAIRLWQGAGMGWLSA
ncbi:hypothetical protein [Herbaspirillum seropedicae]|uniref:hypothetical protein n=1 Tax=Herbaspirillum seropedicae TaxID=964 RepID=UPI000847DBAA|nr:hypothetical protein [Herbaspirillum seropedicae]AON55775.1 hypothetical protein Hsc_3509 [Herbaspirillum seropedicae]